jgi:peptidoglycan/LPS O-acetylase OafA/YrhL
MNKPRANEIDLLRFLAAMAVVLFHYTFRGYVAHSSSMPYPPLDAVTKYGSYGVQLFFLISGFVILMSASSGSLKHFVISRIVRLYPAFWVCCTLTFLVLLLFGKGRPTVIQYLANMTMLSGFPVVQKFLPVSHMDGSYWSLVVEMRFYALVAVVLLLRQIHRAEYFLAGWLVTVALFELAGIDHLRDVLIVDYAAYFIAGAMLYRVWSHGMSWLRMGVILGCWVLALYESWIGVAKLEANNHTAMDRGIVLSIVTACFILMFLVATKKTGWVGRRNWILLGALTYPLYLVHQAVGYVVFNHLYPAVDRHLLLWGTAAMMIAVARVINVRVEQRVAGPFKGRLNRWWDGADAFFAPVAAARDPLASESDNRPDTTA